MGGDAVHSDVLGKKQGIKTTEKNILTKIREESANIGQKL